MSGLMSEMTMDAEDFFRFLIGEQITVRIDLLQCTCRSGCKLQAIAFSKNQSKDSQIITHAERLASFSSGHASGEWRKVRTFKCEFNMWTLSKFAKGEK